MKNLQTVPLQTSQSYPLWPLRAVGRWPSDEPGKVVPARSDLLPSPPKRARAWAKSCPQADSFSHPENNLMTANNNDCRYCSPEITRLASHALIFVHQQTLFDQ